MSKIFFRRPYSSFVHFLVLLTIILAMLTQATSINAESAQKDLQSKSEPDSVLAVLRTPNIRKSDPLRLKNAIDEAGRTKLVEAIDDLITLITFNEEDIYPPPSMVKSTERADRYPAASALFLIGKPALPAIIKLIEKHKEGDVESRIAFSTFVEIFKDDSVGRVAYLKDAIANATSPQAKQRLARAAEKLERLEK